jgi:hypothetical protein
VRLDDLDEEFRRWIDIREGIGREIAAHRGHPGENTRRREDRVRQLEEEYARVQQRILEIDRQIRCIRSARAHTIARGI